MTMWILIEMMFATAVAVGIIVSCLRDAKKLRKTHDFTGTKLEGRIDPARKIHAARYFSTLLILMAVIIFSLVLLLVLPAGYRPLLYVPYALWFLAFVGGSIYFAPPIRRSP